MPNTQSPVISNTRQKLEVLRTELVNERATFIPHWQELSDFILPRRLRVNVTDTNKGDRRGLKIIDGVTSRAARTLRSGMMGGITSPARPWFRLTTPYRDLSEVSSVKEWLHYVTELMRTVFLRSNLYNTLPTIYGDMGTFAVGCMFVEEDIERVLRTYHFPVGSYMLANDAKLRVRVFFREFRMTIRQLIDKFGVLDKEGNVTNWENFSVTVKNLWTNASQREQWIDVCHVILPNDDYSESKKQSKFKKYKSCYYEKGYAGTNEGSNYMNGADQSKLLRESGYDNFPVLAPRWEVCGEDIYGTTCPGMDSLGDTKQLQLLHRRKAQALDKHVNPPMTGPTRLKQSAPSTLPGNITYDDVREGTAGFRPVFQTLPDIKGVLENIQDIRNCIRESYFVDLFRMMIDSAQAQPITAEEVRARESEKLLSLGPVLEQLNQDLLDPLVDLAFAYMLGQGLIPPAPPELQGQPLKVEYISIMAQAQKLVGIGSLERFSSFLGNLVTVTGDRTVLDKVDLDQFIEEYGDDTSLPPKIIRTKEEVDKIRQGRAQAMADQQKAEMLAGGAKTAKDLSQTDLGGQNALTALLNQAKAGQLAPAQ